MDADRTKLTRVTATRTECRRCHQPVRWWRAIEWIQGNREASGWLCVDFSPDDAGTVVKTGSTWLDPDSGRKVTVARRLRNPDQIAAAIADNELRFTLHTRTCRPGTDN